MDSTQFDYKSTPNEPFRPNNQRAANKGPQRPTSAQAQKLNYSGAGQYYESQGGSNQAYPNIGRSRPTTAVPNRQGGLGLPERNPAEQVIEELDAEEEARLVERNTFNQPPQIQNYTDIQKLMPRNINVEKEKLYEDTLHLKQTINTLKQENLQLKTRNLNLERDNVKLSKAVEKIANPGVTYGNKPESALIVALKKQVKDAKDELKVRLDEIEVMKRSTKFTKVQELEIELKAYMDENLRLKDNFEELQRLKPQINPEDFNALEERCYLQNNLIESLQREHERLGAEVRYLQQENYGLQTTIDNEVKTTQKLRADAKRLKSQLANKDKELRNWQLYRPQAEPAATISTTKANTKPLLNEAHGLGSAGKQARPTTTTSHTRPQANEKENQLHAEIAQLRQQNAELESKYRVMMGGKPQPQSQPQPQPQPQLQPSLHPPQTGYGETEARPKSRHNPNEGKIEHKPEPRVEQQHRVKPEGSSELRVARPESAKHEGRPKSAIKEKQEAKSSNKLPRVKFDEAKQIVRGLILGLKLKRVPSNKALEPILKLPGQQVTLGDVAKALVPTGIRDEKEALLLARYIFEPAEELVEQDFTRSQDIASVRAVLTELIGDYKVPSEDQLKAARKELTEVLYRYEQSIDTQFSILDDDCNGHLSEEKLVSAFETLEIHLSQAALELLVGKLYEETGSIKRLNYEHVFELFESEGSKAKDDSETKVGGTSKPVKDEEYDEEYDVDDDQDEEAYDDEDYEKDDDQ